MSFGNGPKLVNNGIILSLDANDKNSYPGSGNFWYDVSGNGYSASFANYGVGVVPSFQSSLINYFQFTGISPSGPHYTGGGYMTLSNNLDTNNATIECWFNNNTSATYVMVLGGKTATSSVYQGYTLYLNGSAIGKADARITTGGGTANTDISGNYSYNTWYHYVLTYNGANMFTYLNGVQLATAAKTGNCNTGVNFLIGAQNPSGVPQAFFSGAIAKMTVYNRGLSANEVVQNYSALKSRFNLK